MLAAIGFNNQAIFETDEIDDVAIVNDLLPSPSLAQSSMSQQIPNLALCIRWISTHKSCALHEPLPAFLNFRQTHNTTLKPLSPCGRGVGVWGQLASASPNFPAPSKIKSAANRDATPHPPTPAARAPPSPARGEGLSSNIATAAGAKDDEVVITQRASPIGFWWR